MANQDEPEKDKTTQTEPEKGEGGTQTEPNAAQGGEEKDDEGVKDTHGQPGINKERHDKEMAAKDAEIAELKKQIADAAKTEETAKALTEKIEAIEKSQADERVTFKLELAGCRNAKAAKALLGNYEGSVEKLKEAEPWLFSDGKEAKQTGSTGLKPGGSATGAPKTIKDALKQMGEAK